MKEKNISYIKIENDNVIMGKEVYTKLNEISYFTFIIGFEILQVDCITQCIEKNEIYGCDILYDFCNYLANEYIESEEYKDLKHSAYEMLYKYIKNNGGILKMFKDYFKIEE